MEMKQIDNMEAKKTICHRILTALPAWFGIPQAIEEYTNNVAEMPFYVLYDSDRDIGFLAIKKTSKDTAEIYVMGIDAHYHHQGLGRSLFHACYDWCKANGLTLLQVKTLDSSHSDKYYAMTRKFYEAMGFKEVECIPEIWGKENPCLLMIMCVV